MDVYVDGKRVRLDPAQAIGKGGEADVYALGSDRALKVFKGPDHPDLVGLPAEQNAARQRLDLHQTKLRRFPGGLPARVVAPLSLATSRDGSQVLGYTMQLVRDAEVLARAYLSWRDQTGAAASRQTVFLDLHTTVDAIHHAGAVIGDFNDLNVLVRDNGAWLIDADSFQFGAYPCPVFTLRFLDPRLLAPGQAATGLHFDADSDWYAYAVMLFEALLGVHPFGGLHRPARPSQRVQQDDRARHRLPVWHADVRYPANAVRLQTLPDEWLELFDRIFVHDQRGVFPSMMLFGLQYTVCTQCGAEHARILCPFCHAYVTGAKAQVTVTVRGGIAVESIFVTPGRIVAVRRHGQRLVWLAHDGQSYQREDGRHVLNGPFDARLRVQLHGDSTLVARGGQMIDLDLHGKPGPRLPVDVVDGEPQFASNGLDIFRIANGTLIRDTGDVQLGSDSLGGRTIGTVLAGLTRFWVGADFGLGFYRAGQLQVGFVFGTRSGTFNDTVALPRWPGQLLDADCVFGDGIAWLFSRSREQGRDVMRCVVVRADGTVIAADATDRDEPAWLQPTRGRCAVGNSVFVATDRGLERIIVENGRLVVARKFPDTMEVIHPGCLLVPGTDGLFVIEARQISLVRLAATGGTSHAPPTT